MARTPMPFATRAFEVRDAPARDRTRAGSAAPPVHAGPAPAAERGEGT
ncbi:hypothetical protein BJY14_000940 [Actinomadura luteofluorescens]|uniref:Uncharacterized protein n=1 Tax=Actinomadura luteofluorescens TaxID=46163 RepID=A0A7Y9ECB4_9ACTN|nr:hypothetical protein [Actinomadura luteofluorescens]NYD44957.1 hypothetical protein [Actinomadura luteofluorescens]